MEAMHLQCFPPIYALREWKLHGGVHYVSGSCIRVPTNDEHVHKHTQSTTRGNTFETTFFSA